MPRPVREQQGLSLQVQEQRGRVLSRRVLEQRALEQQGLSLQVREQAVQEQRVLALSRRVRVQGLPGLEHSRDPPGRGSA